MGHDATMVDEIGMPRNVIVILLDSLNRHLLGAYGSTEFDTPNLDRVAARALRFDATTPARCRAYPPATTCCAARSTSCGGRGARSRCGRTPITDPLRLAGVTTMLVSDHPHLFETGGENYHTDFGGWEYERGHEGDPWRTAPDPSWVGAPAMPAREGWIAPYDTRGRGSATRRTSRGPGR